MRDQQPTPQVHPFIATTEEVRAFLAGRKTQARRPMKPQPADVDQDQGGVALLYETGRDYERATTIGEPPFTSPFGQAGDLLWVQEPTAFWHDRDGAKQRVLGRLADVHDPEWNGLGCDDPWWLDVDWYATAQMPRWASRLTLRLTDLRVEHLHAISEDDAWHEGIQGGPRGEDDYWASVGDPDWEGRSNIYQDSQSGLETGVAVEIQAFIDLWDSINTSNGCEWASAPWVWVPTFEVAEVDAGDPVLSQGAEAQGGPG